MQGTIGQMRVSVPWMLFKLMARPASLGGLLWVCHAMALAKPVMWEGWVSWVLDGDTITVLPQGQPSPIRVRLDGIDAPESCQPGGEQARDVLIGWVLRQPVQLKVWREDTYGRWIATVYRDGEDINARLVRQGWAWAYSFRVGRGPYAHAQRQAQEAKLGLFALSGQAMSPPVFRRFHGSCHAETEDSGWVR